MSGVVKKIVIKDILFSLIRNTRTVNNQPGALDEKENLETQKLEH